MAKFRATVDNQPGRHSVVLHNGAQSRSLEIAPKPDGYGSSLSGGELLFLALATCYCNDIDREANKRGILVEWVEVEVEGDFEREGGPASNIAYRARMKAQAGRVFFVDRKPFQVTSQNSHQNRCFSY